MSPRRESFRVLAVGAHPDDVELFCGGTLIRMAEVGAEAAILDLTRGEMGTLGTPEIRAREARRAAKLMGVPLRENLDLGDARLESTIANRDRLAARLRKLRPDVVLAPWREDRHPDHAAAGRLVREAAFAARLAKLDLEGLPPFAPGIVLYYPGHDCPATQVVVDITGVFERKMKAVRAYRSQFPPGGRREGPAPVGFSDYLWQIESRARHFGTLAGTKYAEGFVLEGPVKLDHPGRLLEWSGLA